ncbi:U3 small nucleolar RNA-associated 11 [Babesia ovis]|uniref:U3 small nucleolar RNA-associated 11 n=1 Tax=Babesia ovis TaxID=5869 RepID=A0A9W5TC06_BABOV|nr:U3 small nucleolar RNA-associated 11 [Babesia ovis]
MTDGLRHVVHRRVHLERSQPKARRSQVGQFLEKKKDYKKRAERFHVMERRIRDLAAKTRFRNEDEFNFKMVHGKLGDDGVVVLPSASAVEARKLDGKKKFRRTIDQLDRNRFVLQHRTTVKSRRAESAITDNATLLMGGNSHVTFSDDDESPSGAEEGSSGHFSGASKRQGKLPLGTTRTRATKRLEEHLELVNDTIKAQREDLALRQSLDAERNLRLALHQKRQVRRVPGTNVHLFPFVRQK